MTTINRRLLDTVHYLTVEDISFASDKIGHGTYGRTSLASWLQADTLIFKGRLRDILIFALMAFDVADAAIYEKFELVSARKFLNVQNLGATDIVGLIDLDPTAGQNIVLPNDITFLENLTDQYRADWTTTKNMVFERKTAPAERTLYKGTVLQALCYALQFHSTLGAPVYTLFDIALMEASSGVSKGVEFVDMGGSSGPVEYEAALLTLANLLLSCV